MNEEQDDIDYKALSKQYEALSKELSIRLGHVRQYITNIARNPLARRAVDIDQICSGLNQICYGRKPNGEKRDDRK